MIKNLLIRMPNWLGDFVMATPVLTDIRDHLPDVKITVMVKKDLADLLRGDDRIDEIFLFERPKSSFERRQEEKNIRKKIEMGKYDAGLLLTNSFSSAWWFYHGKVPIRIGYADHFRSPLLTNALKKEAVHQCDQYKKLLKPLGIEKSDTLPSLVLPEEEIKKAKNNLLNRGIKEKATLIGVQASSAYGPAKRWPAENFHTLAKELVKEADLYLLFFGAPADRPIIDDICKGLGKRVINMAGETTLLELSALISICDLFVSNDSGPMHIAAALHRPMVALFGSTDPLKTGPKDKGAIVLQKKVPCSPCYLRKCPIDFPCMRNIAVKEVLQQIQKLRDKSDVQISVT